MFALRWAWAWIGLLAVILCLADVAVNYSQLPARVATHFNAAGQPDGWGTRERYVTLLLLLLTTVTGVSVAMPLMVWVLPTSLINVPNVEYWMAPKRAEMTRVMVFDRVGWLACATLLLMVAIVHILLHANLQPLPRADGLFTAIGVYFAYFVVWLAEVIWRFGVAARE